jgi:hypothetical protein
MHLPIEAALWIAMWRTFKLGHYLAALQWRRITEQDLPKEGDEVYAPESGELAEQVTIFDAYSKLDPPRWIEDGWTHFRALIAPPADKAGA